MRDLTQMKTELRKIAETWVAEKPKVRGAKLLSRRTGLSYSSCQRFFNDTSPMSLESLLLIATNLLDTSELKLFFAKHELSILSPAFSEISRLDAGGETLLNVIELLSRHSGTTAKEISARVGEVGVRLLEELRDQQTIVTSHDVLRFRPKVEMGIPVRSKIIEAMLCSKNNRNGAIRIQSLNEYGTNKLNMAVDNFLAVVDEIFTNDRNWGDKPASIALVSNRG